MKNVVAASSDVHSSTVFGDVLARANERVSDADVEAARAASEQTRQRYFALGPLVMFAAHGDQ